MKAPSVQDFAVIGQNVKRARKDNGLSSDSQAFYFTLLGCLFQLQDIEIDAAITDDEYRVAHGDSPGKDRGIDAVYIDEQTTPPTIHLFNCKYTDKIDKTRTFFPSTEIDKISTFIGQLMSADLQLLKDINRSLKDKVTEIWAQTSEKNAHFVVHIASNYTEGLTKEEDQRLTHALQVYSHFTHKVHVQGSLATQLAKGGRAVINGKFRPVHKNYFQKPAGDINALILHVEAIQIIRMLCSDAKLRNDVNADVADISQTTLCEDAFEDNVRVYLRSNSKVNRNIIATILSQENQRFFYFNNGITITCETFRYPTNQAAPIIELENVQVVNGGQTVHALFEAFLKDQDSISPVDLLCRVYQTKDAELSSSIAERTNSQTPVKTRDIQSIDIVQIKLQKQFQSLGLFYERKRNQFQDELKVKRIDAERCGQVSLAFYHKLPLEAKNKKDLIFGEKYEEIFSDSTTAEKLLLPLTIFNHIEDKRISSKAAGDSWLRYASYHLLYATRLLSDQRVLSLELANSPMICGLYAAAKKAVRSARTMAKEKQGEEYEDVFFCKKCSSQITY